MIKNAQLLVNHPLLLLEKLGGLTILERHLFSLLRAGIERAWVHTRKPNDEAMASLRLPESLEIIWAGGASPPPCPAPYLAVSGDYLVGVETLARIAGDAYPAPAAFQDAQGGVVVTVIPFSEEKQTPPKALPFPEGAAAFLKLPLESGPAMEWLLAQGPKSQDGFMARHFDRYISMRATRALLDTDVSPNTVTALSLAVGLSGSFLFLIPGRGLHACAAALVWLHCVLDGCDGELARLRFQETALGADLDFWADNLVHLALFTCLGLGFYLAGAGVFALVLAACADAGVIGSAGLAFMRRRKAAGRSSPETGLLQRLETILAQRDFIYLLLAMTCWDLTYYFLWAAAVGAPLFFAVMMLRPTEPADPLTAAT